MEIVRETEPKLVKNKRTLNINFKLKIKNRTKIIDKFKETHKLKLHSIFNLEKIFNTNFRIINIFKWMRFERIQKKDWFGLIVMKKLNENCSNN